MINNKIKNLIENEYDPRLVKLVIKGFLKLVHKKVLKKDEITKEKIIDMINYFEKDTDYEYKKYII
ncbi:hypothetical protein [Fusobacterium varium]|uniref:hypothetical protein n=1 Tax=Fusobacterium varium TaxID=856 RepID=UPI00242CF8DA|nr:hypothetical protein [Fusobacterium varium]